MGDEVISGITRKPVGEVNVLVPQVAVYFTVLMLAVVSAGADHA